PGGGSGRAGSRQRPEPALGGLTAPRSPARHPKECGSCQSRRGRSIHRGPPATGAAKSSCRRTAVCAKVTSTAAGPRCAPFIRRSFMNQPLRWTSLAGVLLAALVLPAGAEDKDKDSFRLSEQEKRLLELTNQERKKED